MDTIIDKENACITLVIDEPLNAMHLSDLQTRFDELPLGLGTTIILDCAGMDYICSSGLRIFLTMQKKATSVGAKLIIRKLQPMVMNVFTMTGFNGLFTIED